MHHPTDRIKHHILYIRRAALVGISIGYGFTKWDRSDNPPLDDRYTPNEDAHVRECVPSLQLHGLIILTEAVLLFPNTKLHHWLPHEAICRRYFKCQLPLGSVVRYFSKTDCKTMQDLARQSVQKNKATR